MLQYIFLSLNSKVENAKCKKKYSSINGTKIFESLTANVHMAKYTYLNINLPMIVIFAREYITSGIFVLAIIDTPKISKLYNLLLYLNNK